MSVEGGAELLAREGLHIEAFFHNFGEGLAVRGCGPVAMGEDTEKGNFEVTGEDTGIGPRRGVLLSLEVVQDDPRDGGMPSALRKRRVSRV